MRTILDCFDAELVERTKEILAEAGIPFRIGVASEGEITSLRLEVEDSDAERAAGLVEAAHESIESDRSILKCLRCGAGMVAKELSPSEEGEELLVAEYRCPRCGAPGLMNLS